MSTASNRKLAAILFADIVGYTSIMQADEALALRKISRYQLLLEEAAKSFNGQVLKNYGDGSLMTFSNSVDAVKAAKQIQEQAKEEPNVPLRIGIHIGEFVIEKGDIYGNGVNLASRLESLGIEGAVLFSKNVFQKIKNLPEFEFQSLGDFDFKNVDEPMEVFALANDGFAIPGREEMKGKVRTATKETEGRFFQHIWKKKIPQILIAYILLAWLGLQLFDWALMQFGISPHWAQIFFITVIGIIPSLLVYLNNRERIHQTKLSLGEKILFPSNFALIGLVLFFMFKSADLGAISKNVTYVNEDGESETYEIIKAEFKKQFPIFPFEPIIKDDSLNNWIGLFMPNPLSYFLNQDKYLEVVGLFLMAQRAKEQSYFTTVEKINGSKIFRNKYYVDGRYRVGNNEYEFIPAIRNKINGKLITEQSFISDNLFSALDSVVMFIRNNVGLSQSQIDESLVLGSGEIIASQNINALKEYATGMLLENKVLHLEKANELDSLWSHPALSLIDHHTRFSMGKLESKVLIDQVFRNMKNLPFQEQIGIRIQKHLIYGEWDKAEQLVRLQLEIEPNNDDYNYMLSDIFLRTSQIDKYIEQAEKHYASNPSLGTGAKAVMASLMKGEPKKIINTLKPILILDPKLSWALQYMAEAYIHMEQYDLAQETINKITLNYPTSEVNYAKWLEAIAYLKSNGNSIQTLEKFVGRYRTDHNEGIVDLRIIGDHLFSKAENQNGSFRYLADEKNVMKGSNRKAWQTEILLNDMGEVYASINTESFGERESVWYGWKQDSLIWNAENLLKAGRYDKAYDAYKKAIAAHPEHYYLIQHLEHLIYLRNHTEEEVQQNLQRIAGDYSGAKFWIENGLLIYKRPGLARRIFRPISDNRFVSLSYYRGIYEFKEENGKIVGVQNYVHDFETDEWTLLPNWYYERTEFLD